MSANTLQVSAELIQKDDQPFSVVVTVSGSANATVAEIFQAAVTEAEKHCSPRPGHRVARGRKSSAFSDESFILRYWFPLVDPKDMGDNGIDELTGLRRD